VDFENISTVLSLQVPTWEIVLGVKPFHTYPHLLRGRFGINKGPDRASARTQIYINLCCPHPQFAWLGDLICSKGAVPRIQMEILQELLCLCTVSTLLRLATT